MPALNHINFDQFGESMPTGEVFHGVEMKRGALPISVHDVRPWGARTISRHELSDKVFATQPGLDPHGVKHYVENGSSNSQRYQPSYEDDPPEWSVLDRAPNIIRSGGVDYVIHGHHRVAAALLRGDTHINARVWDRDQHPVDSRIARGRRS